MAHRHAYERDLEKVAKSVALALQQHPEWEKDALALRDRLDALIDEALPDPGRERKGILETPARSDEVARPDAPFTGTEPRE